MVVDISCLKQNMDMRLMLFSKKTLEKLNVSPLNQNVQKSIQISVTPFLLTSQHPLIGILQCCFSKIRLCNFDKGNVNSLKTVVHPTIRTLFIRKHQHYIAISTRIYNDNSFLRGYLSHKKNNPQYFSFRKSPQLYL